MPHGRPDWYNITPMIQVHASEDVNELAARLGTPDTWDRRGNVLFIDDFTQGLAKYDFLVVGAGSTYGLRCTVGLHSSVALWMDPDSGVNDAVQATINLPNPKSAVVGIEAAFNYTLANSAPGISINYCDGAYAYTFTLRIDCAGVDIAYYNEDGNYVNLEEDIVWPIYTSYFHIFKLVVDLSKYEYMRAIVDDRSYSLVGLKGKRSAGGGLLAARYILGAGWNIARPEPVSFDYMIVTLGED